jgi:hypothetical protein
MAEEPLWGLSPELIVAGCSGGLSIVYALKKPQPWELIAGLITGGATANYFAVPVFKLWAGIPILSSLPLLAVAFLIGIGAKYICITALARLRAWLPYKE